MDVIYHFYDDWITFILPYLIPDKLKTPSSPSTLSKDYSKFFVDNFLFSVSRSFFVKKDEKSFANSRPFSFWDSFLLIRTPLKKSQISDNIGVIQISFKSDNKPVNSNNEFFTAKDVIKKK